MEGSIEIRQLGLGDLNVLMDMRMEVLSAVFGIKEAPAGLRRANLDYYISHVGAGKHVPLVAMIGAEVAGCGAVCFTEEMPSPDNPSGRCGYLMNIYTRPQWRGRGVASAIVKRLLDICRDRGVSKVTLETTGQARSLYERLGFRPYPDILKLASD